jgi:hypothetical protein
MDKPDSWTTVVAAVVVFVAASPSLIPPGPGLTDNYGAMRVLLVLGPVAMVTLALIGRFVLGGTGSGGGSDDDR